MGPARVDHKYSEARVRVALAPSRIGLAWIAAMAAATLALIAITPGPSLARILAATWVGCAALHALHRVALHRGARGACVLRLGSEGEVEVQDASGGWLGGTVRQGSFVAPWLTIVRWRPAGARFDRSVVLLPDMLPAEDLRRVRVWLRWS